MLEAAKDWLSGSKPDEEEPEEQEPEREHRPTFGNHQLKESSNKSLGWFCRSCGTQLKTLRQAEAGILDGKDVGPQLEAVRANPKQCPNQPGGIVAEAMDWRDYLPWN